MSRSIGSTIKLTAVGIVIAFLTGIMIYAALGFPVTSATDLSTTVTIRTSVATDCGCPQTATSTQTVTCPQGYDCFVFSAPTSDEIVIGIMLVMIFAAGVMTYGTRRLF